MPGDHRLDALVQLPRRADVDRADPLDQLGFVARSGAVSHWLSPPERTPLAAFPSRNALFGCSFRGLCAPPLPPWPAPSPASVAGAGEALSSTSSSRATPVRARTSRVVSLASRTFRAR